MSKRAAAVIDFFIIMICLCGFAVSVYIFQYEYIGALRSFPPKPANFVHTETSFPLFDVDGGEKEPVLKIPEAESIVYIGKGRQDIYFSWAGATGAPSYTVQISNESGFEKPVINKTTRDNYFIYGKDETTLVPGQYFWNVSYGADGYSSSRTGMFIAVDKEYSQRLIFPPDRYSIEETYLPDLRFSWETNINYEVRFQVSPLPDFSRNEIDAAVTDGYYQGISLPPGEWYWRILAKPDGGEDAIPTPARRFTMFLPLAGL
jgi:hypothetical protein